MTYSPEHPEAILNRKLHALKREAESLWTRWKSGDLGKMAFMATGEVLQANARALGYELKSFKPNSVEAATADDENCVVMAFKLEVETNGKAT